MNTKKNVSRSLAELFAEIADDLMEATDTEILEDCKAAGESPETIAAETNTLLAATIKRHRQQKLNEARASYERTVAQLQSRAGRRLIPSTPSARRELFMNVVAKTEALELRFRDYKELSDDDIESWLEHFDQLGLLDPKKDEEK